MKQNLMANDFISTEEELINRLAQDLNLNAEDPIAQAVLFSVVSDCNRRYAELEPIFEKYQDLFCPWCGRMHSSKSHEKLSKEFTDKK